MRARTRLAVPTSLACLVAVAALVAPALAAPGGKRPPARPAIELNLLGTHATGVFDGSAAEITAHDPSTQRLFVVNAATGTVDVLDVADPTTPTKIDTLQTRGLASRDGSVTDADSVVNSVDVSAGVVAVAVAAGDTVSRGWVAFFSTADSTFLGAVRAGALPDMLTFTPDGRSVLVANEGEPADDFSSDPEGSVSIVDVSGSIAGLSQDDVRSATFTAYDEGRELADGVRVFGPDVPVPAGQDPAGRVARNLEPEYLTVDKRSRTAWVTLQEANAIAVLDLASGQFTDVRPIPLKDWSAAGNVLDASNRDDAINLQNWPVVGLAMPDAVTSYQVRGATYLVTANEGDAREFGDYVEPARIGDLELCADAFPDAAELQLDENLGRLNVTTAGGQRAGEGCYEQLQAFGGRSFSVFDGAGELVFDSGALMETTIARLIDTGELPRDAFNATNDENDSFDNRSDDKGIEPEGVTVGKVGGRTYAFVGLERIGGVMTFDVTDPRGAFFVDYVNNRDFTAVFDDEYGFAAAGDLGAEGVELIAADDSPTGTPVLAVANEVSGTTSLFAVDRVGRGRARG